MLTKAKKTQNSKTFLVNSERDQTNKIPYFRTRGQQYRRPAIQPRALRPGRLAHIQKETTGATNFIFLFIYILALCSINWAALSFAIGNRINCTHSLHVVQLIPINSVRTYLFLGFLSRKGKNGTLGSLCCPSVRRNRSLILITIQCIYMEKLQVIVVQRNDDCNNNEFKIVFVFN